MSRRGIASKCAIFALLLQLSTEIRTSTATSSSDTASVGIRQRRRNASGTSQAAAAAFADATTKPRVQVKSSFDAIGIGTELQSAMQTRTAVMGVDDLDDLENRDHVFAISVYQPRKIAAVKETPKGGTIAPSTRSSDDIRFATTEQNYELSADRTDTTSSLGVASKARSNRSKSHGNVGGAAVAAAAAVTEPTGTSSPGTSGGFSRAKFSKDRRKAKKSAFVSTTTQTSVATEIEKDESCSRETAKATSKRQRKGKRARLSARYVEAAKPFARSTSAVLKDAEEKAPSIRTRDPLVSFLRNRRRMIPTIASSTDSSLRLSERDDVKLTSTTRRETRVSDGKSLRGEDQVRTVGKVLRKGDTIPVASTAKGLGDTVADSDAKIPMLANGRSAKANGATEEERREEVAPHEESIDKEYDGDDKEESLAGVSKDFYYEDNTKEATSEDQHSDINKGEIKAEGGGEEGRGAGGGGEKDAAHYEKGGATEREEDYHESHGEKGKKNYESEHAHEDLEKGHHDEERHRKRYEEKEGEEKEHSENGGYREERRQREKGEKRAEFSEKGEHQKGHSTKGQHVVHKKDEYEKKTEFFDEFHEEGDADKVGASYEEHASEKGGHAKYGHEDEALHEEKRDELKGHERSQQHGEKRGKRYEEGRSEDRQRKEKFGKKDRREGGKRWAYRKAHQSPDADGKGASAQGHR